MIKEYFVALTPLTGKRAEAGSHEAQSLSFNIVPLLCGDCCVTDFAKGIIMPKVEKNYRSQRYRAEWEKESWTSGWLSAGKRMEKAHCRVCDKELVAGKSEFIGHTKTSTHISHLLSEFSQMNR